MMTREDIQKHIKDIETEIRHTTNKSYRQLLSRRLAAYKNLLPRARTLHKLEKGDVKFINGTTQSNQILAAWQRKFKGVDAHEYIDY